MPRPLLPNLTAPQSWPLTAGQRLPNLTAGQWLPITQPHLRSVRHAAPVGVRLERESTELVDAHRLTQGRNGDRRNRVGQVVKIVKA